MSTLAQADSLEDAVESAAEAVRRALGTQPPDLLLVFPSRHHLFDYGRLLPLLQEELGPRQILGCSAGGVIADDQEVESGPALVLTAAFLPDVQTRLVTFTNEELPELDGSPRPWRELIGVEPEEHPDFLILADPFSLDVARLLEGLDYAYPRAVKIGGLASGAQGPGSNALFAHDRIRRTGGAVLSLRGNIAVDTIVAQGCRPVGSPARVTDCENHLLKGLDGRSPMDFLQDLYGELSERDQELARNSLFLGVVMDESQEELGHGDFLIRNVLGMHRETGSMAVGTQLRLGQTVQFHLRDGSTASLELEQLLRRYGQKPSEGDPAGALLFSCLGRGVSLYGEPHHDSRRLQEAIGPVPLGGFFCNGEIGPVGGTTYLHGYTSAFGIIRPRING